ncbi:type II toxin-antitoxin system PemK/MazF family toxin [Chamaesiphon polymorphus]|uniref:mRNA interferase n=1 Tax=Chamaesiphon polymorphus CCALA 037 TaxID=2107692 RepID=A0A2T1GK39_9CYAN|nr:type II toxin-antitoxin system PemK/MazF family toxin [Chamaesiphon polymorphus]PSB58192.1 PemK family transcriptional regulator [Chamaesiphon polymorphus CCALA 037]
MAARSKLAHPLRGEIYLVNFDPTLGAELQKTRPALILQNDTSNQFSPITIVAGISSQFDRVLYPTEVSIVAPEGGLDRDSVVLLNQIRSIDRQRLVKKLGIVSEATIEKIDRAIQISLGLVDR